MRLALVGIAGGLLVFALILLPSIWLQRRRFGRVRPARLVGVAVICVYTMSLAGLTVAPAYDVEVTCRSRSGGVARWDPFHSVAEVLGMQRGGAGLLELATSFPVLQVLMNMALFVPLGMILRGVFRQDATTSVALSMLLSALIEVTQYTGAFGLYPCGVRIADIEDLLANAAGAWIGALLAPLLTRWQVPLFTREDRRLDDERRDDDHPDGHGGAGGGSDGDGDSVEDLFRRGF